MKSRTTQAFRDLLHALPKSIQRQAHKAYKQFMRDPTYPALHFKPVDPADPSVYSARIGKKYRALGVVRGDTVY